MADYYSWLAQNKTIVGSLLVSPNYVMVKDGINAWLQLSGSTGVSNYYVQHYGGSANDLRAYLPMRIEITVNGGTTFVYSVPTTAVITSVGSYYRTAVTGTYRMSIPTDGSAITIETTVTTRYGLSDAATYSFTQQAYGAAKNTVTGPTELVTGKKYTYSFQNPAASQGNVTYRFYLCYFQGSSPVTSGLPTGYYAPVSYTSGISTESISSIDVAVKFNSAPTGYVAPHRIPNGGYYLYLQARLMATFANSDFLQATIGDSYMDITSVTSRTEVDDNLKPVITSVALAGTELQKYGGYVGGKSTAILTVTAQFQCGGSLNYVTVEERIGGAYIQTVTGGRQSRTVYLSIEGERTGEAAFIVTVDDSVWGVSSDAYTENVTIYHYWTPRLDSYSAERCRVGAEGDSGAFYYDGVWYVLDDTGDYAKISWSSFFSPLNNRNSKTLRIKRPRSNTTGNMVTQVITPSAYQESSFLVCPAHKRSSYLIVFILTDDYYQSTGEQGSNTVAYGLPLDTEAATFDFPANGNGLGIGKVAQSLDMLDLAATWTLLVYDDYTDPQNNGTLLIGGYHEDTGSDEKLTDWMRQVEEELYRLDGRLF